MKRNQKKIIAVGAIVLAALIVVFGIVYFMTKPDTQSGSKQITVSVIFADSTEKTHEISTDAEYLRGALEEKNLISGDESEFGLFVTTVDGVTVDSSKEEWWCFTKGGESLMSGVDTTPIADGDSFEITLTTGYDQY